MLHSVVSCCLLPCTIGVQSFTAQVLSGDALQGRWFGSKLTNSNQVLMLNGDAYLLWRDGRVRPFPPPPTGDELRFRPLTIGPGDVAWYIDPGRESMRIVRGDGALLDARSFLSIEAVGVTIDGAFAFNGAMSDGTVRPFIWSSTKELVQLADGQQPPVKLTAVSPKGRLAGINTLFHADEWDGSPYLYDVGRWKTLRLPSGHQAASVSDVSDDGWVVGTVKRLPAGPARPETFGRAVLWELGTLKFLPDIAIVGGSSKKALATEAKAINNSHAIVGRYSISMKLVKGESMPLGSEETDWRACLWESDRLVDLTSHIELTNLVLTNAYDINSLGSILCTGYLLHGGERSRVSVLLKRP